jgi:HAMP domain-containing protein
MKKLRFGLQARFLLAMGVALLVVLALLGLLLQRQSAMQSEVDVLGREAMQSMAADALGRRGEAMVEQLADSLANPLYYSDLDAIGITMRAASRQPDVAYVLVYGADGNIVHDGSYDIAAYGQRMNDPLARAAVASDRLLTQWSPQIMDVSEAISIGNQRIGGVRVGFSLAEIRASEERAAGNLNNRLLELGRRHMGWFAALLAALVVVGIGVAWYVQRTLVKPIRQLADAANAIGTGDYDAKHLVSDRHDEVGDLVRAFSDMNDSVARHDRDVRRMAYTDALTGLTNRLAFR